MDHIVLIIFVQSHPIKKQTNESNAEEEPKMNILHIDRSTLKYLTYLNWMSRFVCRARDIKHT